MISIVGLHVTQGQTEIQKVEARIIFDDDFTYIGHACNVFQSLHSYRVVQSG